MHQKKGEQATAYQPSVEVPVPYQAHADRAAVVQHRGSCAIRAHRCCWTQNAAEASPCCRGLGLHTASLCPAHSLKAGEEIRIKDCVGARRCFCSQILQDLLLTQTASLLSSEFGRAEITELLPVLEGNLWFCQDWGLGAPLFSWLQD